MRKIKNKFQICVTMSDILGILCIKKFSKIFLKILFYLNYFINKFNKYLVSIFDYIYFISFEKNALFFLSNVHQTKKKSCNIEITPFEMLFNSLKQQA